MRSMMMVLATIGSAASAQVATRPVETLGGVPSETELRSAARSQWCEDTATAARKSSCDVFAHRSRALLDLRMRVVAATDANGGTLSTADRDRFQSELDAINSRFGRQLRNAMVYSVDSTGKSIIG